MLSKDIVVNKIIEFANSKLTEMSSQNPFMLLARPFFARAINNNISKLDSLLGIIADEKGMVDVEGIITEMIDNLLVAPLTKFPNTLGGIEIGEGTIKLNIPLMDKQLIFDTNDIEIFKQSLIK